MKLDVYDLIAIAGLATLGVGLWLVHPGLSLTVVGLVGLVFGVVGSLRESRPAARTAREGSGTEG